jgi:hypothetical protein
MNNTPAQTIAKQNQYQIEHLFQELLRNAQEAQLTAQSLVAQIQAASQGSPTTMGTYEISKLQDLASSLKTQQIELQAEFKLRKTLEVLANPNAE